MRDGEQQQEESSDEVQKRYICLIQELHELREGIADDDARLESVVSRSNVLFKRIKTCSELKLDAKITAMSTGLACKGIEKKMEPEDVGSRMLAEVMCSSLIDRLCEAALECYIGMSFVDSLVLGRCGMARSRDRIQQPRKRYLNIDKDAMRPVEKDMQIEKESEIVCKMNRMVVEERAMDYFEFVIDLESFSKTIENIMYFSLAMRSGKACLKSQDGKLFICPPSNDESEMMHLVVEMTYEEYVEISARMKMADMRVYEFCR